MANKCENCPQNCCIDFKIGQELIDPKGLEEELARFSFVKKTRVEISLDPSGNERLIGVYNCQRFSTKDHTCIDYETEPRPSFCKNTGIKSTPNTQCLLKSNNERKTA